MFTDIVFTVGLLFILFYFIFLWGKKRIGSAVLFPNSLDVGILHLSVFCIMYNRQEAYCST